MGGTRIRYNTIYIHHGGERSSEESGEGRSPVQIRALDDSTRVTREAEVKSVPNTTTGNQEFRSKVPW